MSSRRARHRAPVAPLAWASRALLAAATVPVGALAGCAVAAVSSSADRPEVGIAGLAAAGVPLGVHGWRQRTQRAAVHGRHAAVPPGVAGIWPDAGVVATRALTAEPVEALEASAVVPATEVATEVVEAPAAPRYLTVRLEAPVAAAAEAEDLPAAAGAAVPRQREAARVFAVSAGPRLVEVERACEVAELQRIWDAGTGPDTGVVAVPALADVVVAVALVGDVRRQHAA